MKSVSLFVLGAPWIFLFLGILTLDSAVDFVDPGFYNMGSFDKKCSVSAHSLVWQDHLSGKPSQL